MSVTQTIIEQANADIYQCPTAVTQEVTELTIGDLHANAMYMMHFLVANGVVNISEENYQRLKDIYQKPELKKQDLQEFNTIIEQLDIGETPLIRLIGDELCDRGQNDYFIFKILAKLKQSGIQTEILLSNHGIEFLIPYEQNSVLKAPNIVKPNLTNSMNNMQKLIKESVINKKEVDALIKNSYLPDLKLIAYSLADNHITIFSHAGIGLEVIKALAAKFAEKGVVYQDSSAKELAQTIEDINAVFAQSVREGKTHRLLVEHINKSPSYDSHQDDPVNFVIWNRGYDDLSREPQHKGYHLYFVHGHDSKESTHDNIFNLDNKNFKSLMKHEGSYKILGGQGGPVDEFKIDKNNPLSAQLVQLKAKADNLYTHEHHKAYDSAMELFDTINQAYNEYQKNKDLQQFKSTCSDALDKARPELEKHRGWSEFLVNLAIAIPTLGVGL